MAITLVELDKKVKELESKLADLKAARRVIADLDEGWAEEQKPNNEIGLEGKIDLSNVQIPERSKSKPTLVDDLKSIISRLDDQEFTVNHLYALLQRMGKDNGAKHLKNRVSLGVKKLSDEGFIRRTFEGAGNEPHRYKRATRAGLLLNRLDDGLPPAPPPPTDKKPRLFNED